MRRRGSQPDYGLELISSFCFSSYTTTSKQKLLTRSGFPNREDVASYMYVGRVPEREGGRKRETNIMGNKLRIWWRGQQSSFFLLCFFFSVFSGFSCSSITTTTTPQEKPPVPSIINQCVKHILTDTGTAIEMGGEEKRPPETDLLDRARQQ